MQLYDMLAAVLLAEGGVLGAGLSVVLGHAAFQQLRTARLRSGLRTGRQVVARVLAGATDRPALGRLPVDKAIEVVADATRSVDAAGRARLAELPVYAALTERAARWCASPSWPRRLKGIRLLVILGGGESTVPPLLEDARAEVRSAAAAWAANHPSPELASRLVRMLSDDALACRLTAHRTLIRMGLHAVPALIDHMSEETPASLATALLVASRVHDSALMGPALAHRGSSDPDVRAAVVQVIASGGGSDGVEGLEGFLDDPAPAVRAAAAAGLGGLGHWPSSPRLAGMLSDPAWEVRRAAGLALDRLGGPGQLYLQRALDSSDRFAQDMARQVLDRGGPAHFADNGIAPDAFVTNGKERG
ncbi:HEAT repeat domain-containing protein [Pseudarthrobacter sp. L19]|uniref:HEAT repeat domain-containing protein n=1 Tax=Pseudarthrobacter sp. L19 TaxID=3423951 RepID=UPI003D7BCBBE